MKRSIFVLNAVACGAAATLGTGRLALPSERFKAATITRRRATFASRPGGCGTHRHGARWSTYTLRELIS
jgi:hypothetical protein